MLTTTAGMVTGSTLTSECLPPYHANIWKLALNTNYCWLTGEYQEQSVMWSVMWWLIGYQSLRVEPSRLNSAPRRSQSHHSRRGSFIGAQPSFNSSFSWLEPTRAEYNDHNLPKTIFTCLTALKQIQSLWWSGLCVFCPIGLLVMQRRESVLYFGNFIKYIYDARPQHFNDSLTRSCKVAKGELSLYEWLKDLNNNNEPNCNLQRPFSRALFGNFYRFARELYWNGLYLSHCKAQVDFFLMEKLF